MTVEREQLVFENKNLVRKCAKDLHIRLDDDLMQEGLFALCRAANNYDTTKKTSFSTYAYSYIRGALLTFINKTNCLIGGKRKGTKYEKVNVALFSDYGIMDIVDKIEDTENYAELLIVFDESYKELGETQGKVFELLRNGYDIPQIEQKLHIDKSTIKQYIKQLKQYVKEYFYE